MEFGFQNGIIYRTRLHKIRGIYIPAMPTYYILSALAGTILVDVPRRWAALRVAGITCQAACVIRHQWDPVQQYRTPGPHGMGKDT